MTLTKEPTLDKQMAAAAEQLVAERHVPLATYRLQLHPGFTFRDAAAIVPYLRALGVGDVYTSPLFAARSGSTHGYDVADYGEISPALGGEAGFARFSATLKEHGMGLVLDVVPNHMGIGSDNPWWMEVLENGQSSPYATFFDIDWNPVKPELQGKVLLPILGDQYGVVLEAGQLQLQFTDGTFVLCYFEHRLPVAPRSYHAILSSALDEVREALEGDAPDLQEYESILTALSYLPPRTEQDPERRAERQREKEVIKRRLAALAATNATVRAAIEGEVARLNGTPGDGRSFDRLHELIEDQAYRLAFWRVAAEEINYRRFFDINDLAAVREEVPAMFAAAHALVMRLLVQGHAHGLRIDHPDGLYDPPAYFRHLQELFVQERLRAEEPDLLNEELAEGVAAWAARHQQRATRGAPWPLYVVAEKILSEREPLPRDWAVDGTTGYDFLNAVNGIFVKRGSERALDATYRRFLAPDDPTHVLSFDAIVAQAKQEIMAGPLTSEITSLSHQLERINEKNRRYRDFTRRGLTQALSAVIASMSIYRTYISGPGQVSPRDRRYLQEAVRAARRRHPEIPRALLGFVEETLLLKNLDEFRPEDRAAVVEVVRRIQQMTGPVMAKSMEDTAFYRYHRLVSLNEVGGHPDQFGSDVAAFHKENVERARHWPHSMLASSTHDTKRSEDVRARLNVLSELPDEWSAAVVRWAALNAGHKQLIDGDLMPDRNDEYLLYQTLVGAWPLADEGRTTANGSDPFAAFRARIVAYMEKASKEAKVHTSWLNPDEEYDAALRQFVEAVLDNSGDNPFLADIAAFAGRVAFFGQVNSLAQTLLKLTAPGVPDIYQGTELWDGSLVDPDNRRPVDYRLRERLLRGLDQQVEKAGEGRGKLLRRLWEGRADGRIKLYIVAQTLRLRQQHPALFSEGDYQPLGAEGLRADHLCAFGRNYGDERLVVVAPRLVATMTGGEELLPTGEAAWGDTRLALPDERPGALYRDLLSGQQVAVSAEGTLPLAAALAHLPLALLVRVG